MKQKKGDDNLIPFSHIKGENNMNDAITVGSKVSGCISYLDKASKLYRPFQFIGTVEGQRDVTWSWDSLQRPDILTYIRTDQHMQKSYGESDLVIHSAICNSPLRLLPQDDIDIDPAEAFGERKVRVILSCSQELVPEEQVKFEKSRRISRDVMYCRSSARNATRSTNPCG